MMELTREILDELAEPFPPDVIEFKPGATTGDKKKALALAYVEVRHYFDRLNQVVGANWADQYLFINTTGEIIKCDLTICGVTRCDIGEKNSDDVNTATSAIAQSFKRACVKFGLGRHLYAVESVWVPYDAQRKQFTTDGFKRLRQLVTGQAPRAAHKPATKLDGEIAEYQAEENPPPKQRTNGKKATVGTGKWADQAKTLAEKVPYFMTSNGPNYHHMLASALKLGFEAVTDENLADIIAALEQHANEAANAEAA